MGEWQGDSKRRAHQLYKEALIRLRQSSVSYQLRSLLDKQSVADYQAVADETPALASTRYRLNQLR